MGDTSEKNLGDLTWIKRIWIHVWYIYQHLPSKSTKRKIYNFTYIGSAVPGTGGGCQERAVPRTHIYTIHGSCHRVLYLRGISRCPRKCHLFRPPWTKPARDTQQEFTMVFVWTKTSRFDFPEIKVFPLLNHNLGWGIHSHSWVLGGGFDHCLDFFAIALGDAAANFNWVAKTKNS